MSISVFNGRKWAEDEKQELQNKVSVLKSKGLEPKLLWIQLGEDKASSLYGKLKEKVAKELGISFEKFQVSDRNHSELAVLKIKEKIFSANTDQNVHGIMVQLPMYENGRRLDEEQQSKILNLINPQKDVDCLTAENLGLIMANSIRFLPATVEAVRKILMTISKLNNQEIADWLKGKKITVVGGGLEIGRPLVNWLSNNGAVILWARSSAKDSLEKLTQQADVLISAVGKPNLITKEMVKNGVIAIDVGSPKGDFEFESVKDKASFITPVPGGVGPMTVMNLMENLVQAAFSQLAMNLND